MCSLFWYRLSLLHVPQEHLFVGIFNLFLQRVLKNGDQLMFVCTASRDFVTGKTRTRRVPDYNYLRSKTPESEKLSGALSFIRTTLACTFQLIILSLNSECRTLDLLLLALDDFVNQDLTCPMTLPLFHIQEKKTAIIHRTRVFKIFWNQLSTKHCYLRIFNTKKSQQASPFMVSMELTFFPVCHYFPMSRV